MFSRKSGLVPGFTTIKFNFNCISITQNTKHLYFNYKIQITFVKVTKYKIPYMHFKYVFQITCISITTTLPMKPWWQRAVWISCVIQIALLTFEVIYILHLPCLFRLFLSISPFSYYALIVDLPSFTAVFISILLRRAVSLCLFLHVVHYPSLPIVVTHLCSVSSFSTPFPCYFLLILYFLLPFLVLAFVDILHLQLSYSHPTPSPSPPPSPIPRECSADLRTDSLMRSWLVVTSRLAASSRSCLAILDWRRSVLKEIREMF